ncbi:unnamed protein product [Arctia plantaginis]|uniref:Uncharacterized protein n=1 Tax=Arctia plantaginis TaxID=874455 RepID=A0A8S0Z1I2_ARCPL|nr:unnamed protein product [Arctia plantaginis]
MMNENTYATWFACGRKAAANASSSGALRGRAPLMSPAGVAWELGACISRPRWYARRFPPVSRGGLVDLVSGGGLPTRRAPAAAPVSIAAGVTRAGTACRSSYRPSRRRSPCDAYSPLNYYITGLLGIKTSNLRATPRKKKSRLILYRNKFKVPI